jgi:phosphoserine phosphatase
MPSFATILANPQEKNLNQEIVDQFAKNCERLIVSRIIIDGIAAEVEFGGKCPAKIEGFDLIIQERKNIKLLVCDMESTIIDNEFLDDIAAHLGIGEKVAAITARAMNNEIGFEESLQQRMALVLGLRYDDAMALMHEKLKYNGGARALIEFCKANGIYTMLVSGGFTIFTEVVAEELGFDKYHANKLIFTNGILTGVETPFLGRAQKLEITQKQATKMGISLSEVAAIGDGGNDLDLLGAVGLPIAYHAKPAVKEAIKNQFNHTDLSGLISCLR